MRVNDASHDIDRTMTALAHPTRRAILERVMQREARVTELAEPFAMSLNAVSKHIRVLERARLVRRRRAWREHWVSFNPAPLDEVSAWIEKRRVFWTARLDALDALLKAEDLAAAIPSDKKGKPK
ncbi:MAG: ArsR/SmtB family transcription factor [Isosphaerales bacterium]